MKTLRNKARQNPASISTAEALRLAQAGEPGYEVFDMGLARDRARNPGRSVGLTDGEAWSIMADGETSVEGLNDSPFD